jgi:predicted DNA-binding ribbon-helix-helix protein
MTVRQLVEELNARKRRKREARTLSLDTEFYQALQRYCKERDLPVSEVVDRLIQEFLAEVHEFKAG